MIRYLLTALFAVAALGASVATAEDKKPLEGKIVCTKCALGETESCGNALQVKTGDKIVTYYLADKGKTEAYHVCKGEKSAKVTGKIVEKDKKQTIESPKVEVVK